MDKGNQTQKRKPMFPLLPLLMGGLLSETIHRPPLQVSGFYGGNPIYTPRHGKFKGYMREYRRLRWGCNKRQKR